MVIHIVKKILSLCLLLVLSGCSGATEQSSTAPQTTTEASAPGASESASPSATSSPTSEEGAEDETQSSESADDKDEQSEEASASEAETKKPTPAPSPTESESPAEAEKKLTLSLVAENDSASSCWVVIDGMVYDLTAWIAQHPGGSGAILRLCGGDGTDQFSGKHGGQAAPASALREYALGQLQD